MKAFVWERYGPPEALRLAEVEKPTPEADEVLVKVLGVSVNPADWHSLRAKPAFSRLTLGLLRPKHRILGVDVAGRVEAVGSGVTRFKPGDEVYANLLDHGYGAFAEYVSVPVNVMSLKQANLSFEEAAAVPMAGVTALQGLRHQRRDPARTEASDQWRLRGRRPFRRSDRPRLRGRGDGRDQHPERRPRPFARHLSRGRLQDHRLRP
jgi:NADPH:quinone reductase-like Zn-dependent oxidoreductase